MKNKTKLLYYFWIVKVIFDMFYQVKILTIVSFFISLILLIHAIFKKKYIFNKNDIPIIILIVLFTLSFLKSPSEYLNYFKIVSAFIIYFLGRFYYQDFETTNEALMKALLFAFLINLFVCIIGKGTIIWGNAKTLKGVYFYKTDFAIMLIYFFNIWLFNKKRSSFKFIITIITTILILLCNARIIYLCILISLYIYVIFKSPKSKNIVNLKNFLLICLLGVICVFALRELSQTDFFIKNNLISLNFSSLSDLINGSNTQGRNEIWKVLLKKFNNCDIFTKLFGAEMSFNSLNGFSGLNEHSTYIKVLLNTGYIGLGIFIIFIINILFTIKKEKDKKISFLTFSLFVIFLIVGISVPTITYTNCSWIPMFFLGVISSRYKYNLRRIHNEK